MKCSAEISYYPLINDPKGRIKDFIADLRQYNNIKVEPGSISTRVFGEYIDVMTALTEVMGKAFEGPTSSVIIKILNADRDK